MTSDSLNWYRCLTAALCPTKQKNGAWFILRPKTFKAVISIAKSKKKREFKKVALVLAFVFSTVWVSASYVLAFLDKQPVESVSNTSIAVLLGAIVCYYTANAAEKNSRNKYGVDEQGHFVSSVPDSTQAKRRPDQTTYTKTEGE